MNEQARLRLQSIISEARRLSNINKINRAQQYEHLKRQLGNLDIDAREYTEAVKRMARALNY